MKLHFFTVITSIVLFQVLICNSLRHMTYIAYNQKTLIQWSMGPSRQFTVKNRGDDMLAFFGCDTDRALEYVCENTTALCRMHISKSQPDLKKGEVVFTALVKHVLLPVVSMSGLLQLCIGPSYTFRKRPLVKDNELLCHAWHKHRDTKGYKLYPNYEVQDSVALAVYTWYMTADNYQEMRKNDTTKVFIPLFKDSYRLPIYAVVYTPYNKPKCQFERLSVQENALDLKKRQTPRKLAPRTYKFTTFVTSGKMNSGIYNFKCQVHNELEDLSKSLIITFISGPIIVVKDSNDYRVFFAPQDTSGSFTILIYTTTPITSFLMKRSDGISSNGQILSEQVSYSPYGIVAVYNINIPWLKDQMSGVYTASVTNQDKESVTQNIEILKAKALKVLASPTLQTVAEGVRVSFECVVLGNLVEELSWTRDFESLNETKYAVEIKSFRNGETSELRLTFLNPTLNDSGHYVCTASNRFERHAVHVELSVWPFGSPYLDSAQKLNILSSHYHEGVNVLNISDDDLFEQWSGIDVMSSDSSRSSTPAIVVGVLIVLILLATIVIVGVVVAVKFFKIDPMMWMRSSSTELFKPPKPNDAIGLEKKQAVFMSKSKETKMIDVEDHIPANDPDEFESQQVIKEEVEQMKSSTAILKEEPVQLVPLEEIPVNCAKDGNQLVTSEEEVGEDVPLLVKTTDKDSKKKRRKKSSKAKNKTKLSATVEDSSVQKERKSRKDKAHVKSERKHRDSDKKSAKKKDKHTEASNFKKKEN